MVPTVEFLPAYNKAGNRRPLTFNVDARLIHFEHHSKANLYLIITGILERLEPGQRLATVKFVAYPISSPIGEATVNMPGDMFLAMAAAGSVEMAAALDKAIRLAFADARAREIGQRINESNNGYAVPHTPAPDSQTARGLSQDKLDALKFSLSKFSPEDIAALEDMGKKAAVSSGAAMQGLKDSMSGLSQTIGKAVLDALRNRMRP